MVRDRYLNDATSCGAEPELFASAKLAFFGAQRYPAFAKELNIVGEVIFGISGSGINFRWRTELNLNSSETLDHDHGTTTYRAGPERSRAGFHFS